MPIISYWLSKSKNWPILLISKHVIMCLYQSSTDVITKEGRNKLAKSGRAPRGFYSASEVMKKLGIASSTLYHYVETGKIRRVVPPDKRDGYYIKAEIDRMVKAKELFMLQYATDTSVYEKAREEDVASITDLGIELFGKNGSPNYETRLAQYHANPDIFYVLKQ